jgi:hypothetical protein
VKAALIGQISKQRLSCPKTVPDVESAALLRGWHRPADHRQVIIIPQRRLRIALARSSIAK